MRVERRHRRSSSRKNHAAAHEPRKEHRPFTRLIDRFRERNAQELYRAFGPDAAISVVPVSQKVEHAFMERLRRCHGHEADVLRIGYHGTNPMNFPSIFSKGFLLPGRGGARVAHGNSHGVGIYTAREGAAWLSKNFCASSMLVCGIIDRVAVPDKVADEGREADGPRFVRRLGRPAKVRAKRQVTQEIQTAQVVQKRLGNFYVSRETDEVRHIGDAMVVFSTNCVAPLLRVDHLPAKLYEPDWQCPPAVPKVVEERDHAAPPPSSPHATAVQVRNMRCTQRALRRRCRQRDRDAKYWH